MKNKSRSGRPQATTSAEDLSLVIRSKRNRRLTAPEITAEFNESRQKDEFVYGKTAFTDGRFK